MDRTRNLELQDNRMPNLEFINVVSPPKSYILPIVLPSDNDLEPA